MKRFLPLLLTLACCALAHRVAAQALIESVQFDSGSHFVFNLTNTALLGGNSNDGNGAVLQLGYYQGATIAHPFDDGAGHSIWIALSGEGSANNAIVDGSSPAELYNQTSIGDTNSNGAGDGTFALSLTFTVGSASSGNNLPSVGTPLAIRFFNATTIALSSFYNTVADPTDTNWVWKNPSAAPTNPVLGMTLDAANLQWYSIAEAGQSSSTAFHTSVPVPEPSTFAMLGAGIAGIALIRRFRRLA